MADLTITPANVFPGSNAVTVKGLVGEDGSLTAGMLVARDSEGRFMPCDADHAEDDFRTPVGIALISSNEGQPTVIQTSGRIRIGATLVVGEAYFSSDNPGGIADDEDDASAGTFLSFVGFAVSTTTLDIRIVYSGVAQL